MPLQIMKLAIAATTTVTTTPTVSRFFYTATATTTGVTTLTIDTADFFGDTGAPATELPDLITDNSYYNVYINGVLQMAGVSAYTAGATGVGSLAITVPAGSTILVGSPIVLEVTNFAPDSDTDVQTKKMTMLTF
ncbi:MULTISPECIES: DUF4183 domain-containing protein [Priestia]|uniref:DUF4183 domain-containing protein n=1 Tax=Priestia TaxID=2800373 RepID=UPI002042232B|nr:MULTISPECIES: DUF4183 domain-containing protein [Priestia]MCM3770799.1 DUF4183 domain-containing protein [Priestia aryabhattai]MDY0941170.1 DUF4183 domain-containing protein [Priestia megaterium]